MKTLKEYILNEGILADIDTQIENGDTDLREAVKEFLYANYKYAQHMIISEKPNSDGYYEVSSPDSVRLKNSKLESLTNGMFIFTRVAGNFSCYMCNIKSLEGAPREVGVQFDCSDCENLKSLEGGPEKVGGAYNCGFCFGLKTLKGAAKEVGNWFNCSGCEKLESLEGGPEKVGGSYSCSNCDSLVTLEGAPKKIHGDFNCEWCADLTYLKGAPEKVSRDFICYCCKNLKDLKGAPKWVGGKFDCSHCNKSFNMEKIAALCKVEKQIICSK